MLRVKTNGLTVKPKGFVENHEHASGEAAIGNTRIAALAKTSQLATFLDFLKDFVCITMYICRFLQLKMRLSDYIISTYRCLRCV